MQQSIRITIDRLTIYKIRTNSYIDENYYILLRAKLRLDSSSLPPFLPSLQIFKFSRRHSIRQVDETKIRKLVGNFIYRINADFRCVPISSRIEGKEKILRFPYFPPPFCFLPKSGDYRARSSTMIDGATFPTNSFTCTRRY